MNIEGLLNLPSASSIEVGSIAPLYSKFLDQLISVGDGNVVLSDPYFLSVPTSGIDRSVAKWLEGLSNEDGTKLNLLSLLSLPFDPSSLWPDGEQRFTDDPVIQMMFTYQGAVSLAEDRSGVPYGLDQLKTRRIMQSDPGLSQLLESIPRKSEIETLASEFVGGQPGNYAYQFWQVCDWSDDWAIVFGVTDNARDEGYPFPWLLGFCRKDSLERNFISLLNAGANSYDFGFYFTYGRVFSSWKLARIALHSEDDWEGPDWDIIGHLQSIDETILDELISKSLYEDTELLVTELREILEVADEIGFGSLSLAELFEEVEAGSCLRELKTALDESKTALDERQEEYGTQAQLRRTQKDKQQEARNERLKPFEAEIEKWIITRFGPNPMRQWSGHAWSAKVKPVRIYIESYVLKNGEFPKGKRDFCSVRFMNRNMLIGTIDFDEIARLVNEDKASS